MNPPPLATKDESMSDIPQKTALHARHLGLGGTMAPFGGWDMPLWYKAGAIKEHLAVIQAAGLFDTSHMDVIFVSGSGARKFLNFAYTRDISDLRTGRCGYGAFLNARGGSIDDAIIYPLDEQRFAVVLNASMAGPVMKHLAVLPGADAVRIDAAEPRLAKLDIQGPASASIVRGMLRDAGRVLEKFPYFSFKGDFDLARSDVALADGTPILLSRTGYTGELGFEIFLPLDKAGQFWDALLAEHAGAGLLPCGLAARDSLRAGAVLPLSHQDIGDWPFINHPWPFALPLDEYGVFSKDFFGSGALDATTAPHTFAFVGHDPRRVDGHEATVVFDGREIGGVTSIVSDMAIGRVDGRVVSLSSPDKPEGWTPRGLACGFIRVREKLAPGTSVILKDKRREIQVETALDIRPHRTARKKLSDFL